MLRIHIDITDLNRRAPLTGIPTDTWWIFYMLATSKEFDIGGVISLSWSQRGVFLGIPKLLPSIAELYGAIAEQKEWFGLPFMQRLKLLGKFITRLYYFYYHYRKKHFDVFRIPAVMNESVFLNYLAHDAAFKTTEEWEDIATNLKYFLHLTGRLMHAGRSGSPLRHKYSRDIVLHWKEDEPDIFYIPDVFRIKVPRHILTVMRLHDWIPITHPDTIPGRYQIYHRYLVLQRIPDNVVFVSNSEFTKEKTLELFPELEGRIETIYIAVPDVFSPSQQGQIEKVRSIILTHAETVKKLKRKPAPAYLERYRQRIRKIVEDMPKVKYFFSVSSMDPRKNYKGMLLAYKQFLAKLPPKERDKIVFIIRAAPGWKSDDTIALMEELEEQGRFIWLGKKLSFDDLAVVNAHAHAFIFVSFIEGFGMPPVEAMACGVPVLSSDLPVHREIQKEGAFYVNSYSIEKIAEGMYKIYKNTSLRKRLIKNGQRVVQSYRINVLQQQWVEYFKRQYKEHLRRLS